MGWDVAPVVDLVVSVHVDDLGIDHILAFDRHYEAFDVTALPYRNAERT